MQCTHRRRACTASLPVPPSFAASARCTCDPHLLSFCLLTAAALLCSALLLLLCADRVQQQGRDHGREEAKDRLVPLRQRRKHVNGCTTARSIERRGSNKEVKRTKCIGEIVVLSSRQCSPVVVLYIPNLFHAAHIKQCGGTNREQQNKPQQYRCPSAHTHVIPGRPDAEWREWLYATIDDRHHTNRQPRIRRSTSKHRASKRSK